MAVRCYGALRITSKRYDDDRDDSNVVDRHRIDAGPDPNFHVDADQIRIRIGFKMMPISMGIITQVLHMMENQIFFYF